MVVCGGWVVVEHVIEVVVACVVARLDVDYVVGVVFDVFDGVWLFGVEEAWLVVF